MLYPSFLFSGLLGAFSIFGPGPSATLGRIIFNGYMALIGSALVTFLISRILNCGKTDINHIQSCVLAGGIGVGSICDRAIGPGGALLVGLLSGALSTIFSHFVTPKLQNIQYWHDTRGVFHGHFLPGVFSGLASVVVIGLVIGEKLNNDTGVTFPREDNQPGYQIVLIILTIVFGIVGGAATGAAVSLIDPSLIIYVQIISDVSFLQIRYIVS